jgi:hypothetical protein
MPTYVLALNKERYRLYLRMQGVSVYSNKFRYVYTHEILLGIRQDAAFIVLNDSYQRKDYERIMDVIREAGVTVQHANT